MTNHCINKWIYRDNRAIRIFNNETKETKTE